jgi:hypothetical protein
MGGTRTVPDESQHTYTNFALLFLSFSGDGGGRSVASLIGRLAQKN